ncbi:Synaptobrevin family protein [Tritrichomonas foetus]|uniref:Synaptobrevin family protein n=1 Tax=Tritrichomonas foetus TaxID=1144522 RepID=A0A1J4JML8_9EUKA|nr:Synaptobrevin family protein [Tritrichomonas foetus]|eukprot:OHS98789.1 Synaptobrevin family protein [Tritrichomonas foetus]
MNRAKTIQDILYCCVAYRSVILAQCSISEVKYDKKAQLFLNDINNTLDTRAVKDIGDLKYYAIHEYQGLNFLAIETLSVQSYFTFDFLDDVKDQFLAHYDDKWINAPAFGMQNEFSPILNLMMRPENENGSKELMKMKEKTSKLIKDKLLNDQTKTSSSYTSSNLDRNNDNSKIKIFWMRYRYWIFAIFVIVFMIFVVLIITCEGFTLQNCKKKSEK